MTPQRIFWYFADPMCSWCWGFAPVVSAVKDAYANEFQIALMLGGLRPGTTRPMSAQDREAILHHWRQVHERTGQPFAFDAAMPEGFVYDTEPASRAVIAVAEIDAERTFPYFKTVQAAFYAEGRDVTRPETLAELAGRHGVAAAEFRARFDSDEVRHKLGIHFQQTRQVGVRGFPTVVLQNEAESTLLANGYRSFDELRPEIDAWLTGAT
ncbi:MAG TPA: DsbA family protein [Acidiferrobacterales bacterium]